MTIPQQRELRGFDSYELRLGDELRGERACLGKSLFDVERDLRIKARYIDAIENSDPAGIENQSFVAGYIRSYARYLKLDPEEVYHRFCNESGFQPARARVAAELRKTYTDRRVVDDPFGGSDLAAVLDGRPGFDLAPVMSAAGSLVAVLALVGGIGYGAWTFLNNVQQVASAPAADEAAAVVPLSEITRRPELVATIDPSVYEDDGVLAQLYRTDEAAPLGFSPADGPIAAIDPTTAGVFARTPAPSTAETLAQALSPVVLTPVAAAEGIPVEGQSAPNAIPLAYTNASPAGATPALAPVTAAALPGVAIQAVEEAWVRIEAPGAGVLFSGLMTPGERFSLPASLANAVLKVGNAAGVIILVDGVPYGPMGAKGVVQSGIPLDADSIRASYPRASGPSFQQEASQTGMIGGPADSGRNG